MPTDIGTRLARLEKLLRAAIRAPKLANASLENGSVDVYDESGSLRAVIGQQPDGTSGVIAVNGPRPPAPSVPEVEPVLGGLRVTWDGGFPDAEAAPLDLSRVQVHVLMSASMQADPRWPTATIEAASGASVTISVNHYGPLWVRLVAVNTSGIPSVASDAVRTSARRAVSGDLGQQVIQQGHIAVGAIATPHLAVGSVTPDHIAVGQGTNLVPDPGFEGAATANTVAAGGTAWSFAPGNRTGVGIRLDCTASAETYWTLPLATVPVLAASQLFLGIDVLVSDDLAAKAVKILARWENSTGEILGYGVAEATSYVPGVWQRITGQVAAPQGTTRAVLCLEASAATAGWVVFDNAQAHTIFGDVTGGARAELGPQGLRLYDEDGEEVVSLVSGQANYLTLRDGTTRVAAIGSTGDASFQDLNVAGKVTIGGDDLTDLYDGPRGIVAMDWMATGVKTATGTEMGYVELAFDAEEGRMYRVVYNGTAECSQTGGSLVLRLRSGYASAPLISSTQLQEARHPLTSTRREARLELIGPCAPNDLIRPGRNRLLLTFTSDSGAPAGQQVTLTGAKGRMGHLSVEDIGEQAPDTGVYNTGGAVVPDPPVKVKREYTASWSGSYANRSGYNSYYGNRMVAGYYSANNGTQAALVGFGGSLAKDLAGAKLLKVEVYLYANHWYYASGGTAVLKVHGHASRPSKFSADQASSKTVTKWARASGQWVDITSIFDSTKFRGIAIDPNTTNKTSYGMFDGIGQGHPPRLRVTYIK
ncbi:hypothetical protein JHN63_19565 [Streptomyces sp. MBT65]|uniref:hypothetical protein n=1 Tax=Streptomyces sp. MBT65 TaxID=1488395 RepID=UPI00190C4B10|nr:hypothetical protein [Streptomyces sp. MBT65]MBK3575975.1 hypothetical protein [Streptomyces sp. MBT65]